MATDTSVEAESMTFTGNGGITNESSASGGHALGIWSNGYASTSVTTTDPSTYLFVRTRGDQCNGAPIVDVKVDGTSVYTASVSSTSYTEIGTALSIAAGAHTLEAGFTNDYNQTLPTKCDRNLYVDKLTIVGQPFASTSWRNKPLAANATIASDSATRVAELQRLLGLYGSWVNTTQYSEPVYTVPAGQPTVAVKPTDGNAGLTQQLAAVPLPSNAQPAAGTDHQLIVWQPSTDTYWDFEGLQKDLLGNWTTWWGGRLQTLSGNAAQFPAPYGGAASGLPYLAGVQRIKELQRGSIDHAVDIAISDTKASAFDWPATRTDGWSTSATAIQEGTRFRLPSGLNVDALSLTPYAKMVAKAIQRYGMIVTDTDKGSAVTFAAEDPTPTGTDPYTNGIFGGVARNHLFDGFPWDQLQVVDQSVR